MESLITPLQDKIEDWKKTANQLDKDHAKGTKTMLIHEGPASYEEKLVSDERNHKHMHG